MTAGPLLTTHLSLFTLAFSANDTQSRGHCTLLTHKQSAL